MWCHKASMVASTWWNNSDRLAACVMLPLHTKHAHSNQCFHFVIILKLYLARLETRRQTGYSVTRHFLKGLALHLHDCVLSIEG